MHSKIERKESALMSKLSRRHKLWYKKTKTKRFRRWSRTADRLYIVKEKCYVHAFATHGRTVPRLQSLATSSIVSQAGYFQTGHISEDSSKMAHVTVRSNNVR